LSTRVFVIALTTVVVLYLAPTAAADPVFSPDPLEVSDQEVGTSGPGVNVLVTNDSPDPYEISDVSLDGSDASGFEIVGDGCTGVVLTQANNCMVTVRFKPTEAGDWLAVLVLDSVAGGDNFGVLVGGFAYDPPPIVADPDALAFPPTRVASSTSAEIFFTNMGDGPTRVGTASITGSDRFSLHDGCLEVSLEPGESCVVDVAFGPSQAGLHTASLVLAGSGPASGRTVPLSGTALPQADIQIEPASIDFGVLETPFTPVSRQVVIRNIAGNPVRLRLQASGFAGRASPRITNNTCGSGSLAVGASCRLDLSVRPSRDGAFAGSLQVLSSPYLEVLGTAPVTGEARGQLLSSTESSMRLLLGHFARRWHMAPRATLRRHGFQSRFLGSLDGSVRLTIARAPAGSSVAQTRLLARGGARVESGEEVILRARLTRAGRKLLAGPRRLRVRARLVFTGPDVGSVVAVRDLVLRRAPK
jgi:centrosomal CEP192-like protein